MTTLKRLIWLYFWLLLFEGALRKWIFPSLDSVLLLVRDPVVLLIYFLAAGRGAFPMNPMVVIGFILAVLAGLASIATGLAPEIVVYGVRVNILHVPLIYVMGKVFDRNDVIKIGRFCLLLAIPISLLIAEQFRSPGDAWINKGAFTTNYGTIRPSAIFPFITGTAAYLAMVAAFLVYGFLEKRIYPLWLQIGASLALLVSLGVSGSRLAIASVVIIAGVAVISVVLRGRGYVGIIWAVIALFVAFAVLGQTEVFKMGTDQLTQRFDDASPDKSNVTSFATARVAGDTFTALEVASQVPLLGYGTGLGTSFGANLAMGKRAFLGTEGEWGRLIWESGPFLGIALVLYRCGLGLAIFLVAFKAFKQGQIFPMLLFSACAFLVIQGQWGVTNGLGFACFGAGLVLAACRVPKKFSKVESLPSAATH